MKKARAWSPGLQSTPRYGDGTAGGDGRDVGN